MRPNPHTGRRDNNGALPNRGDPFRSPWEHAGMNRGALVFRAPGFPTIDAPPIEDNVLDKALEGMPITVASSLSELKERLRVHDIAVLVLSYGSAFPIDAWPQLKTFLDEGGGLAVLGGAPLHEPVRWDPQSAGAWVRGPRQSAFAHDLLIGPAEPITIGSGWKTVSTPGTTAGFSGAMPDDSKTTWALTLRLTNEKFFPDEHGSAGPRDAVARPLSHILDPTGTPRGCPLLEIDRLRGPSKGARWVFATTDAKLDANAIRAIVSRAMQGASDFRVIPVRASVPIGDEEILLYVSNLWPDRSDKPRPLSIVVTDDAGKKVFEGPLPVEPCEVTKEEPCEQPRGFVRIKAKLGPGLYHVVATDLGLQGSPNVTRTAFWMKDDKLLASGPKITVSTDWLRKDGKPFPIVGTTYMASDVHRGFLFDPNPEVWNADFAEMKKRGINFVRTGIWTAWSVVMEKPGEADAEVLTALDAFVLTAAKHGIVVCFNLFAFLPPAYGGTNPYLDKQSLDGQKALIKVLAARFKNVSWIHWDLINEPSYAPQSKLWRTRPIGDAHEATAWKAWVEKRHGNNVGKLRSIWHVPEADVLAVPRDDDFAQSPVQSDKRPRKARDFREFTEDAITEWAKTMRAALRAAAGEGTLVTLGQDEGGIYERATQQLMAPSLDYTAVHTWWKNDDLLWDGVVTKVIGKPSLHQETGLMRLEDIDGNPWRSPREAALLLERKLGYAFASRGAGVVEWVWNVNPYMPIDEESTIGLFRPDGTAKPELDALQRFAAFFSSTAAAASAGAPQLDDFEPDPVMLVVPHARAFLGMSGNIDASKHVVRALAERFGIVPAAISDLRLTAAALKGVKLIIVPGADVLDESAAKALLEASKSGGSKVLITGAITGDSYGMETPSLRALGVLGASRPVAMLERSAWAAASGFVAFEGLLQESLRRADKPSLTAKLPAGNVWHEPLPLELARDREPLVKLLGAALASARVPGLMAEEAAGGGVAARVLLAPRVALLVAINERAEAATRKLLVDQHAIELRIPARGASMMMVERPSGKPIATLTPAL